MARDLTAIAAQVATKLGTEPINILVVKWGYTGPPIRYADKNFNGAQGKILSLSGLDSAIKTSSAGAAGSLSVTLDDTDGSIKTILNSFDAHKGVVKLYQSYQATPGSESLLFTGKINTPLEWSEGDRAITLEVVADIENKELGFSPEEGEFDFIAPSAIGKAWPLCFGSPLRVPAVLITEAIRGTSLTRYGLISQGDLNDLCGRVATRITAQSAKDVADTYEVTNVTTIVNGVPVHSVVQTGVYSDSNYAIVIDNLTSAIIAEESLLESLIADSPTQESELRAYVTACQNRTLNQNLIAGEEARAAQDQTDRATIQASILATEQLINAAEHQVPPDAVQLEALDITLMDQNDALDAVETDLFDAFATLLVLNANVTIYSNQLLALEVIIVRVALTTIVVENGEKFPQAPTEVDIVINGMIFHGSFVGEIFTIDEANLAADTGVVTTSTGKYSEMNVVDSAISLKGKYCYFPGKGLTYCENQADGRAFVNPIFYSHVSDLPVLPGGSVREIWDPILMGGVISETSVFPRTGWLAALKAHGDNVGNGTIPWFSNGMSLLANADYSIEIGDEVYLLSNYKDTYICNLIPSTVVREVLGRRVVDGVTKILPIPSRYYSINLNESIAGQNSTTLRLVRPLKQYQDENWTGEIFVSLTSTVGPNTSDIIKWIIDTHTDLASDASSFATVATALTNYPSHFAYLEKINSLQAVEEIAWQARCVAYSSNGIEYIKYLAAEESELLTITEDDIEYASLGIKYTETENIVTKFTAIWNISYDQEKPGKVVLRNNITKYGLQEQDYQFYIYNIESLVVKSATFWMIRLSNTWKIAKFKTYLNTLALERFDTVKLDLDDLLLASSPIKGSIQSAVYDSENHSIEIEVWTSVRSGEMLTYPYFWPALASPSLSYPLTIDLYAGA